MSILKKLITIGWKADNLTLICRQVLNYYGINNTYSNVDRLIKHHFQHPSMLTLIDTLSAYGVESAAIRKGNYSYSDFETPFICSIQHSDWPQSSFTVVTDVYDKKLTYFDPIKKKDSTLSLDDFSKIDKDIILIMDGTNSKDENDYMKTVRREKFEQIIKLSPILLFTILIVSTLVSNFLSTSFPINWFNTTFFLFTVIGALTSLALVWHDVDAHNPFLKEACGGRKEKINCEAVLTSKVGSFYGFRWSVIGFSYFTSIALSQMLFGTSNKLFISYWLLFSILALPYTIFSIYIQWKIIKQWCQICLIVQVILSVLGLLSLIYFYQYGASVFALTPLAKLVSIGLLIFVLTHKIVPILKSSKESIEYEKKWKRLHFNSAIFNTLLHKEEKISYPINDLGIVIGDPNAKNEIVKVCNPYCGPCGKAHPELEILINSNPNIKLRIIFTATGEKNDKQTLPVQHFLAIQERDGKKQIQKALNDWYAAEIKDYTILSNKYPINSELKKQENKIKDMYSWCQKMKIRVTPTIFINGFQLPDSYRIEELKNILK